MRRELTQRLRPSTFCKVEAITTAVSGVETAFEKATELATSVTDETPAEELDALAAKAPAGGRVPSVCA